jgi:hypothetical protein
LLVCPSGVLLAIADACGHVAAAVQSWANQQQQKQQQQVLLELHSTLTDALLLLWSGFAEVWPGKQSQLLANEHLAPTLPPVIKLAAAVLTNAWPAAADKDTSGNSSSSSRGSSSSSSSRGRSSRNSDAGMRPQTPHDWCKQAMKQAVYVAGFIGMQAVRGTTGLSEQQQCQLLSTVASEELLLLLLADMAFLCQQLNVELAGRSPWACDVSSSSSSSSGSSSSRSRAARQQTLEVPAYHKQLLSALNIGWAEERPRKMLQPMAIDLFAPVALLQLLTEKPCARTIASQQQQQQAGGGDSSNGQQQQQQQQGEVQAVQLKPLTVPAKYVLPLLLCCIELPLLAPGPWRHPAFNDEHLVRSTLLICLDYVAGLVQAVLIRYPRVFAEYVVSGAVGPILWLLAPAVRQQLGLMSSS